MVGYLPVDEGELMLSYEAVSIRGVSRAFGSFVALNDVSLDIRKGEFFSLLGPSGCGKTTLLRIIAGFESLTSGSVFVGGRDMADLPAHKRQTNMVFQNGALFPHLTVSQNVAFGLEMKRVPPAEIQKRVANALEMVRLGGFGDRYIDQLSGGQGQRVALARALINEPEVLLLDEPLSALDLQLRIQMQEELRRLQSHTGSTFIFVTHDQSEAMAMSDRIAVMHRGRLVQVGTPREIYSRPRERFVAEFIGHSNFLKGAIVRSGGGIAVMSVGAGNEVEGSSEEVIAAGTDAQLAVRYENLQLTPVGAPSSRLRGEVVEEIYLGAVIRRRVRIEGVGELVSDAPAGVEEVDLGVGKSVYISWHPEAASILRN